MCHDNNPLLSFFFFWHQNAATSWGPLTHLSMIVTLVLTMLTYGTWQRGHTGAAGQMALMMITKKIDALPSGALYARICPLAKDESCTRAFIKNISHSQNTACLYRAWQMLWSEHLVRERGTIYMLITVYYHFLFSNRFLFTTISLYCRLSMLPEIPTFLQFIEVWVIPYTF